METKLCECGCGLPTKIATRNRIQRGQIKGQPIRYIHGHSGNFKKGSHNFNKGVKARIDSFGYRRIKVFDDHPRKDGNGFVKEHILIAERLLGRPLDPKNVIHHPHGKANNTCFVICENHAYHMFLEQRTRAFYASGHANYRKCRFCKQYDAKENLVTYPKTAYHKTCQQKDWRLKHDLSLLPYSHDQVPAI